MCLFWTLIHAENADFPSFESAKSAFFSVQIKFGVNLFRFRINVSTFERASQQAAQEVSAEEDIHQQCGQRGEKRACHLHIPRDDLTARHVVERDGDGLIPVAGKHHREEEIIPRGGELPDQHNHKTWK